MPTPSASLRRISRTVRATITKFYRHIQTDLHYICAGYDITNYFRPEATAKKTVENAASDGFGSTFSGAAFCLPHQLVGILFSYLVGSKNVA